MNSINNKIILIDDIKDLDEWFILRRSEINMCSKSTFGFTATLFNSDNFGQKLRCIIPQWINNNETAFAKRWITEKKFLEIIKF